MASRFLVLVTSAVAAVLLAGTPSPAAEWTGLFDVAMRREALQRPEMETIRSACLAEQVDPQWRFMEPIAGLKATEGYGSDNSAEDFSWAVMVLSGRVLAGDDMAERALRALLLSFARADAFGQTEESYDPYYALKRQLLPLTVAYSILAPELAARDADVLRDWLDPLVRRIDRLFDREVDRNNHRTLADSVLATWGSIVGDQAMVTRALAHYGTVLAEVRADGTLPLEARRGSRALWYQRQTLASLTVMAEVASGLGQDLYGSRSETGQEFATLLGALLDGLRSPVLVAVYSAENHIPGPERDFLALDTSFLDVRGHGRHYMAFAEAARQGGNGLSFERLNGLFDREIAPERPLIDEFSGGNATCFWGQP